MTRNVIMLSLLATTMLSAPWAQAQEKAADTPDITKSKVGPGSIRVVTEGNTQFSFGGQARIVPTLENNWDFGAGDSVNNAGLTERLKIHANESGWVRDDYVRTEGRLYFNAMPNDQAWTFHAALEFDRPLETATVDERGGKTEATSDFGLERLVGSVALTDDLQLYAGWDVWGIDIGEAQGFVYADDNPGIWLKGGFGGADYSVGYWKLKEDDFRTGPTFAAAEQGDRDLVAGYVDLKPAAGHKIRGFYALDRLTDTNISTTAQTFAGAPLDFSGRSDTTSHHLGAYWLGSFGNLGIMTEGVYQFGEADVSETSTGFSRRSYDIDAYAVAADVTYDMSGIMGFSFVPRIGGLYTSGDESADDGELGGYTSVTDFSRFSKWGGENVIPSDTNFVLGTPLYGFLPEALGNGTPVATGGLQNFSGAGFGRGDNPGLSMVAVGFTTKPWKDLVYKTNLNSFWWNQDSVVQSWVDGTQTRVEAGYVGTEWSHELAWLVNNAVTLKGQFSAFRPGEAAQKATAALTASAGQPGPESDKMATRLGAELIWAF